MLDLDDAPETQTAAPPLPPRPPTRTVNAAAYNDGGPTNTTVQYAWSNVDRNFGTLR
jgi:hypothetical protein